MGYMEIDITEKKTWLAIDGNCGTEFIPNDLFDADEIRRVLEDEDVDASDSMHAILAMIGDYLESSRVWSADLIDGYGVRLSAAGYLDSTPWSVYTTRREAEIAARELESGD